MMNQNYHKLRSHWVWILVTFTCTISCTSMKSVANRNGDLFEIKGQMVVEKDMELDSRYTIFPSARIKTIGNARIRVVEPLNIIGINQVFEDNVNIEFLPGTLNELYISWFGAKGNDGIDDTKAIKKTFEIARDYEYNINVVVPYGVFYINEKIFVESPANKKKSINIKGYGMSQSSDKGSSFFWRGQMEESMFVIRNINLSKLEDLDFFGNSLVRQNLELRPGIYQYIIRNCSFKGCAGPQSTNINLNRGNNIQVSEIQIENCTFHSVDLGNNKFNTEAAISGGLANTKNFYIKNCAFMGYNSGAINIEVSDILTVENCTFAHNEIDIICLLCNTYIKSNYSEWSNAFYKATFSSNTAFSTITNNYFSGHPKDGYIIRDGTGNLYLINNNFGGDASDKNKNNIKWETVPFGTIFSFGNQFVNTPNNGNPFFNRSNQPNTANIISHGDVGGQGSEKRTKVNVGKN